MAPDDASHLAKHKIKGASSKMSNADIDWGNIVISFSAQNWKGSELLLHLYNCNNIGTFLAKTMSAAVTTSLNLATGTPSNH
jgi:hypothetical protein